MSPRVMKPEVKQQIKAPTGVNTNLLPKKSPEKIQEKNEVSSKSFDI